MDIEKLKELIMKQADEKVFFEKYKGFLTTKTGEKADINELKKLAKKIKENQ